MGNFNKYVWLKVSSIYDTKKSENTLGQKKKNCYVALSRPTVKCEKTGSGFFFLLLMSDLGEEFAKIVFNGLKKHLHDLYTRFDCIPPEFSPFETLKKILENSTLSRYVKKKKSDRPTQFLNFGRWGQHNNFFFWPYAWVSTGNFCIKGYEN